MIDLTIQNKDKQNLTSETFVNGKVPTFRDEADAILSQTIPFYGRLADAGATGSSVLKQYKKDDSFDPRDKKYSGMFDNIPENISDDMLDSKNEIQMNAVKRRYDTQVSKIKYIDDTTSGLEYVAKMGAGYALDPIAYTGYGLASKLLAANKMVQASKAIRYASAGTVYGAVDTVSEAIIQEGGTKDYENTLPLTFGFSFALGAGAPMFHDFIAGKTKGRQQEIIKKMTDEEITLDHTPDEFKKLTDEFNDSQLKPIRTSLNRWMGYVTDNKIFASPMQRSWARGGDVSKQAQKFDLAPGLSKDVETGKVMVSAEKNAMDHKYEMMNDFIMYQKSMKESIDGVGKLNGSKLSLEEESKLLVDADIEFAKQRRQYIERKLEIQKDVMEEMEQDILAKHTRDKDIKIQEAEADGSKLGTNEIKELEDEVISKAKIELNDIIIERANVDEKILSLNDIDSNSKGIVDAKLKYSKQMGARIKESGMEGMDYIDPFYYSPTLHNIDNIKADPQGAVKAYEAAIETSPEYIANMKKAIDDLDLKNDTRTKEEILSTQKEIDDLTQYTENLNRAINEVNRAMDGEFVDKDLLQKMFSNKPLVDIDNIPNKFNGTSVIRKKIMSTTGQEIAARHVVVDGKHVIEITDNTELLEEMFNGKNWSSPRELRDGSKADAINPEAFKSVDEMLSFVMSHEKAHETILRLPGETLGKWETRVNQAAFDQLRASRQTTIPFDNMSKTEAELIAFNPKLNADGSVNKSSRAKSDRLTKQYEQSVKKYKDSLMVKNEGNINIDEAAFQIRERLSSAKMRVKELKNLSGSSKDIDALSKVKDSYYRSISYLHYLEGKGASKADISKALKSIGSKKNAVDIIESTLPKDMVNKVDDYIYYKNYPKMASRRFVNKFKDNDIDMTNIDFQNKSYDDKYVPARMKRRTLMIDTANSELNRFQQHGNQMAMDTYHYQMSGRVALQKSVGTYKWDEYKANNKFNNKDDENMIEDLFTSTLGTKQMPSNVNAMGERFFRSMSHYNYATMGGQFAKYGVGEIAAGIYSTGFRYISELVPAMKEVNKMYKGQPLSKIGNDSMAISEALSVFENNRRSRMDDSSFVESSFAKPSKIESGLATMSKKMFRWSGLEAITTLTEMALPRAFMRRMLVEDIGNLLKTSPDLLRYGITKSDLINLKKQPIIFNEKGIITDFNFSKWDQQLANKIKTATTRMSRETIIRPDATRLPGWMVDGSLNPMIKLGRQFMSFTFVAHERLLMRGLNERRASAVVAAGTSAALLFILEAMLDEAAFQVGVIDERKDDITTDEGLKKRVVKSLERGSFSGIIGPIIDQVESMGVYGQAGPANKMLGGPAFNRGEGIIRSATDIYNGRYGTKAQAHAIKLSVPFASILGMNELAEGLSKKVVGIE